MKKFRTVRAMQVQNLVEKLKRQNYQAWNIHLTRYKVIVMLLMACNKIYPNNPYGAYILIHGEYARFLKGNKRRGTYNKSLAVRELLELTESCLCSKCQEKLREKLNERALKLSERESDSEMEILTKLFKECCTD